MSTPAVPDRFVLDGSVTLAWLFHDEQDPYADAIIGKLPHLEMLVPRIWHLEVVILAGRRASGPMQPGRHDKLARLPLRTPILVDGSTEARAWSDTINLARQQSLTEYDAAYLELALLKACHWQRSLRARGRGDGGRGATLPALSRHRGEQPESSPCGSRSRRRRLPWTWSVAPLWRREFDDGTFASSGGITSIDFTCDVDTLLDAIQSAIRDVRKAGFEVTRAEIETGVSRALHPSTNLRCNGLWRGPPRRLSPVSTIPGGLGPPPWTRAWSQESAPDPNGT